MEFSQFAKDLKEIISGGDSCTGANFVKELFQNILDIDDGKFDLDENISVSAYRAYYRGDRKLSHLAPSIRKYVEPELFISYIDSFGGDVQHDIFKKFAAECPGMTESNIPESMAELFKNIIVESVSKKSKKEKALSTQTKKDEPVGEADFSLLNECGNKCPLCRKKLIKSVKGVPIKKFIRVYILPLNLDSYELDIYNKAAAIPANLHSLENQILLCSDCATVYSNNAELSEYAELMDIKRYQMRLAELDDEVYEIKIEKGINDILDALSNMDELPRREDITKWEAFRVDKKIPDDLVLQDMVTDFVLKYYRQIESQYKQREREGKLRFNKIKNEVSQCFELYDEAELSQHEIFERLVAWLQEKTDCDEIPCMVMISFFVQNCEVFRDETA